MQCTCTSWNIRGMTLSSAAGSTSPGPTLRGFPSMSVGIRSHEIWVLAGTLMYPPTLSYCPRSHGQFTGICSIEVWAICTSSGGLHAYISHTIDIWQHILSGVYSCGLRGEQPYFVDHSLASRSIELCSVEVSFEAIVRAGERFLSLDRIEEVVCRGNFCLGEAAALWTRFT